jgi:hypothetical protein
VSAVLLTPLKNHKHAMKAEHAMQKTNGVGVYRIRKRHWYLKVEKV